MNYRRDGPEWKKRMHPQRLMKRLENETARFAIKGETATMLMRKYRPRFRRMIDETLCCNFLTRLY